MSMRVRTKGMEHLPPPAYHPQSTCLTLSIYYNGELESDGYVGGRVRKLDYVDVEKLTFMCFEEYVQDIIAEGTKMRVHTAVKGGHVVLKNDQDLQKYAKKYQKVCREFSVYVVNVDNEVGGNRTDFVVRGQPKDSGVQAEGQPTKTVEVEQPTEDRTKDQVDERMATKQTDNREQFLGPMDIATPLENLDENDFFRRVDNSDEWIAEYERRFGVLPSGNDNNMNEEEHDNYADESGSSDSDFNVDDGYNSMEDEVVLDEIYDQLEEEPKYRVDTAMLNDVQVEWIGSDEVVQDSADSGDDDFAMPEKGSDDDDDNMYEDNISDNVEIGENDTGERVGNLSEDEYLGEDVVGCAEDDLEIHRMSDEDAGEGESFPHFNDKNIFDPEFDLGQTFVSKEIFKRSVDSYAIKIRRSLPCRRSDSRRVYVRCSHRGCPFKINTVKVMNTTPDQEEVWVIRELCIEHTCDDGWDVSNVNTRWLADRYVAWFKSDPKRNVKGFREDVRSALKVNVSVAQAYRAKQLAIQTLQGNPDLQCTKLWDYANELRVTNPGSTIILGTDDVGGEQRFAKFYVCFQAMKLGFKSCRPIIGVDGCHLKGPHGGILLTAVGVDPDNGIFPIAYAVVSIENKENWTWFFSVLKSDLGLGNGMGVTFVSDKQKGLIYALPEVFPTAEQRFCVRHMVLNMMAAGHKGIVLKNAVWKAANAYTVGEFKEAMRKIRDKYPEAADWLKDKHPREWSKSHFLEQCKCDMNLNNSCESFNSCILEARSMPIITMLEWIKEYLMKRWHLNREGDETWDGVLCPTISKILQRNSTHVGGCRPIKASKTHFQIQCSDGGQYAVDLGAKTCSCRSWQLTGIPCMHGLSAIDNDKLTSTDFVEEYYHVSSFRMAYSGIIMPISGPDVWGDTLFIPPLPPKFGRKAGRPTRLRRRGIYEPKNPKQKKNRGPVIRKLRRFQKTIHCGHCHQPGHNVLFCDHLPLSAKMKRDRLIRRACSGPGETSTAREKRNENNPEKENHINNEGPNDNYNDTPTEEQQILPPIITEVVQEAISGPLDVDVPSYSISDAPTMPVPSMFEQLGMSSGAVRTVSKRQAFIVQDVQNAAKDLQQKGRQPKHPRGVKLRVPPTFNDEDVVLTQQSVSSPMVNKNIVVEWGKKFLELK